MPHSERPASPSLLDAARTVARGGGLDAKLTALAAQAQALTAADAVAVLLLDGHGGSLITPDGRDVLAVASVGSAAVRAVEDRRTQTTSVVGGPLARVLPDATSALLVPLVVQDELGEEMEGLLTLGWRDGAEHASMPDDLEAMADLIAVAIRQARLQNTVWEQADYADRLAHTDRLTGLANRVTFERMLELEIARATRQGSPLAIALFDVDGLSAIGREKGGGVADQVLRHVASVLADRVRLLDTVARVGDDEFAVIAPGDAGGAVALRLRDAIAALSPVSDVAVSVSGAVVHHPDDGATGGELLEASHAALTRAKAAGPGAVLGARSAAA